MKAYNATIDRAMVALTTSAEGNDFEGRLRFQDEILTRIERERDRERDLARDRGPRRTSD